jgi:flagellar biogenesis protein FliO
MIAPTAVPIEARVSVVLVLVLVLVVLVVLVLSRMLPSSSTRTTSPLEVRTLSTSPVNL